MSDLLLITPPTVLPITLADAKLQCGYGPDDDADELRSRQIAQKLRGKIAAATRAVENQLSRALMPQTWRVVLDRFPHWSRDYSHSGRPEIWLPKPPFQSIVSFTYLDTAGNSQTVPASTYTVLPGGEEAARIVLAYEQVWPVVLPQPGCITVDFICGYPSPAALPATTKDALLMMVEFLNNVNGENAPMPSAIKNLLSAETNYLT